MAGLLATAARAPGATAADVERGIRRGVAYLNSLQQRDRVWHSGYTVGMTARAGLTLPECGVPTADPAVQGAARAVRREPKRD